VAQKLAGEQRGVGPSAHQNDLLGGGSMGTLGTHAAVIKLGPAPPSTLFLTVTSAQPRLRTLKTDSFFSHSNSRCSIQQIIADRC
jgi:hypothetical protein